MSSGRDVQVEAFLREALYEWARSAASGQMADLDWVDLNANPEADPYRVRRNRRGRLLFRQGRYGRALPPAMLQNIARAEMQGGATLLQALTLAFARTEWLVKSRSLLWTELSPVPLLLARMVEAYGISGEVHRGDPGRLVRLRARLPAWHKRRGEVIEALRLLEEAVHQPPAERLSGHQAVVPVPAGIAGLLEGPVAPRAPVAPTDASPTPAAPPEGAALDEPPPVEEPTDEQPIAALVADTAAKPTLPDHPLAGEVMACRSLKWWTRRAPATPTASELRIEDGFVRFQPRSGSPYPLVREDVCVGWTIGQPLSPLAPRLLPPWACYRIVAAAPETP